ncbi:DedA family protein [Streptomyces marincola]|uniref:DedA family protein n=1 Tax=Streptomyces marincola TaxID=2878388 RepID=UPI001CF2867F|nr:VTT domain-containing protein [Streptomyces marincola]UCM91144.1 VTT domain-containing protein [Streptomyces marincola]
MTAAGAECALAATRAVPPDATQQAVGYPSLFLLVLLGALVPLVPTGAVVSSAAAVAFHHSNAAAFSFGVFVVAAAAAFLGDGVLYWLGGRGVRSRNGSRWLDRIREQAAAEPLARARERLDRRGSAVLLVSRLVPAGRIPVMLACLLARMPLHVYLRGNLPAVLGWAATYQLIGMLGGALFPRPWQGVVAAVALTLLIAAVPAGWRRLRPGARGPSPGRGPGKRRRWRSRGLRGPGGSRAAGPR